MMIQGPARTPYEDGLFFFDFQLSADYPRAPPICHYHSYVTDRLNPNLYEDGKVCVSLLGTWSGKGTETWTPNSNLLQLLVSIQGLILGKVSSALRNVTLDHFMNKKLSYILRAKSFMACFFTSLVLLVIKDQIVLEN